jgi:hypothetical protein
MMVPTRMIAHGERDSIGPWLHRIETAAIGGQAIRGRGGHAAE